MRPLVPTDPTPHGCIGKASRQHATTQANDAPRPPPKGGWAKEGRGGWPQPLSYPDPINTIARGEVNNMNTKHKRSGVRLPKGGYIHRVMMTREVVRQTHHWGASVRMTKDQLDTVELAALMGKMMSRHTKMKMCNHPSFTREGHWDVCDECGWDFHPQGDDE